MAGHLGNRVTGRDPVHSRQQDTADQDNRGGQYLKLIGSGIEQRDQAARALSTQPGAQAAADADHREAGEAVGADKQDVAHAAVDDVRMPLDELPVVVGDVGQVEMGDEDVNFDRHFFGFTQLYHTASDQPINRLLLSALTLLTVYHR